MAFKVNGETITQGLLLMAVRRHVSNRYSLFAPKYGENADYILAAYGFGGDQAGRVGEMLIGEALLGQAIHTSGLVLNEEYIQEHGDLVLSELMNVLGDGIDPLSRY